MARNKDYASKIRRGKKKRQNRSIPSWVTMKTDGKVKSSPHTRREWRNNKLKVD